MKIQVLTSIDHANIILPLMGGFENGLRYIDAQGNPAGGFSCISMVPLPGLATAIVEIDASPALIAEMKASGQFLAWQDVVEAHA